MQRCFNLPRSGQIGNWLEARLQVTLDRQILTRVPAEFYTKAMHRYSCYLLLALTLGFVFGSQCAASLPDGRASPSVQTTQPPPPEVFAPDAAARQTLDEAFGEAAKTGRRVLAVYGGKWCTQCSALQYAMDSGDAAPLAHKGFVVVRIATDDMGALQQFATRLDPELKLTSDDGPLLTILDRRGTLLEARLNTRLLDGGTVSSAKVSKYLNRWSPEAPASEVYQKGLADLRAKGKLGFVEFGADWCVWCHHMDEFFDQSPAASVLHSYYVRIPVDYERNEGAPELAKQLGAPAGDGLPLWAVVDANGKPLANSNSPKGNIGFPGDPNEIAEFIAVIRSTAKGVTPEQLAVIEKSLQKK